MKENQIDMTITIDASLERVWTALSDPNGVAKWMGGKVTIHPRIGGKVSLFEGTITGKVTALEPNRKLAYTWREDDWNEGVPDSEVVYSLSSRGKKTIVRLLHKGLPDENSVKEHREGWKVYFFDPLRDMLEPRK